MLSNSSRPASTGHHRILSSGFFGLILCGLVLFTTGCGGRGQTGAAQAPGPDATPQQVASYLTGNWTVTLNAGDPNELNLPLRLNASAADNGPATVEGTVGGSAISNGTLTSTGQGQSLQFTAQAMTVEGVTGQIEVPGPTTWTAQLNGPQLSGTVRGAGGAPARWTARKGR